MQFVNTVVAGVVRRQSISAVAKPTKHWRCWRKRITCLFLLAQQLLVLGVQLLLQGCNLLAHLRDGHDVVRRVGVDERVAADRRTWHFRRRTGILSITAKTNLSIPNKWRGRERERERESSWRAIPITIQSIASKFKWSIKQTVTIKTLVTSGRWGRLWLFRWLWCCSFAFDELECRSVCFVLARARRYDRVHNQHNIFPSTCGRQLKSRRKYFNRCYWWYMQFSFLFSYPYFQLPSSYLHPCDRRRTSAYKLFIYTHNNDYGEYLSASFKVVGWSGTNLRNSLAGRTSFQNWCTAGTCFL